MLTLQTLLIFLFASISLALVPGPDNIFVLTQSALHGRRAGLMVTLGLCTGLLVHTSAVAIGIAAIVQTSALAFNALKFIGAAYLLYLAWQAFRAPPTDDPDQEPTPASSFALYLRGIVMNVTNPKVAIFFLAFLPQFVDPERGSVTLQIMQLGALFMLATLVIFGAVALAAALLAKWLTQSAAAQRWLNRLAGTVFLALALRLAITRPQ